MHIDKYKKISDFLGNEENSIINEIHLSFILTKRVSI